ncbi:hypothetical protein B0J11DRAFT_36203 [Dendryphion nanum]|uniref:DUF7719 domain-containing protein n=1 Tax=Dendryphion nanum TaxID=256645 RepID=A0A9P9EK55_9PLEO|nr:hypothetical protein B0J11DRAFT_36203 [Dendryphion nanum]
MATSNRKERRAASKNTKSTGFQPSNEINQEGVEFLLQHPDRSGPKGKTLFDLAEDRQREINKTRPGYTSTGEPISETEDPVGPLGNAIFYAISLAMLHVTLDVAVYSQYREEVIWSEILQRAAMATPIFLVLVYLLHVDFSKKFPILRNLFFLALSVTAGCYMVYSGNMHGYFFVMKAAPPIGALWIWSVVEMSLTYALASCAAVLGYLWWNGFQAF